MGFGVLGCLQGLDEHESAAAGHGGGHGAEDLAAVFVVPVVQDVFEQVDVCGRGDGAEDVSGDRVDPVFESA